MDRVRLVGEFDAVDRHDDARAVVPAAKAPAEHHDDVRFGLNHAVDVRPRVLVGVGDQGLVEALLERVEAL
jgi:hypothetical protein